jgi:hypothetical protein
MVRRLRLALPGLAFAFAYYLVGGDTGKAQKMGDCKDGIGRKYCPQTVAAVTPWGFTCVAAADDQLKGGCWHQGGSQNPVTQVYPCISDPYVCQDGSCGPGGAACPSAEAVTNKMGGSCVRMRDETSSCTECRWLYCAQGVAYTSDNPNQPCLNEKCVFYVTKTDSCYPIQP